MIEKEEIAEVLSRYDISHIHMTSFSSHSYLNTTYGAKQEGLKTLGIMQASRLPYYEAFAATRPDVTLTIEKPEDILDEKFQKKLRSYNSIVVPTPSFYEFLGAENLENEFLVPQIGIREITWESNRERQREWLQTAGVKIPEEFEEPSDIDRLCIVKFHGAKGGEKFPLVKSEKDFYREMKKRNIDPEKTKYTIQEYIPGSRFYCHMFFSPFSEKGLRISDGYVEILGFDQRMESPIDELHRTGLTRKEMKELGIEESFTVVGNRLVIPREKLQIPYYNIGKKIVEASQQLFPPGLRGPFCPETVVTKDLKIFTFELSPRIVAGTNAHSPQGAPEGWYTWEEPMSMGRRIAREIKLAIEKNRLEEIVY